MPFFYNGFPASNQPPRQHHPPRPPPALALPRADAVQSWHGQHAHDILMREEVIGDCRLLLGDCREALPTLGEVDSVVTDPPYEIVTGFGSSNLDGNRRMEFDFDQVGITENVVLPAMQVAFSLCSSFHVFCGFDQYRLLSIAAKASGLVPKPFCIVKDCPPPPMPGTWWPSGFELAMYGYRKRAWFGDGDNKKRVNVLKCDAYRHGIRPEEKTGHPTQKWLPAIEYLCKSIVPPGGSCLDPFMGSGTTGVACAKLGRRFTGIEIDPAHFGTACRRIEAAYKQPDLFIARPSPAKQESLGL